MVFFVSSSVSSDVVLLPYILWVLTRARLHIRKLVCRTYISDKNYVIPNCDSFSTAQKCARVLCCSFFFFSYIFVIFLCLCMCVCMFVCSAALGRFVLLSVLRLTQNRKPQSLVRAIKYYSQKSC